MRAALKRTTYDKRLVHTDAVLRTLTGTKGKPMNLKKIKSTTYALLMAGLAMLLTGTYTDNGGFQLAGGMLIFITLIIALGQAGGSNPSD